MALTPLEVLNKVVENTVVDLRLTSARTLANLSAAGRVKSYDATTINWDVIVGGAGVSIEPVTSDGADTSTDVLITQLCYALSYSFYLSCASVTVSLFRL